MTATRCAMSSISGFVSWRTKPFSTMKDENALNRPWPRGQR
jgi:hypothetical protein